MYNTYLELGQRMLKEMVNSAHLISPVHYEPLECEPSGISPMILRRPDGMTDEELKELEEATAGIKEETLPLADIEKETTNELDLKYKDHKERYISRFSDYSGADVTTSILKESDDVPRVCTEIQGIKHITLPWDMISKANHIYDKPVVVAIDAILMPNSMLNELKEDVTDIVLSYRNDHGVQAYQVIKNVELLFEESGVDVNTITVNRGMILAATEVTPLVYGVFKKEEGAVNE